MPEQHRSALERLHSDVGRWEALKRVVENRNAGHKCYLAVRAHECGKKTKTGVPSCA